MRHTASVVFLAAALHCRRPASALTPTPPAGRRCPALRVPPDAPDERLERDPRRSHVRLRIVTPGYARSGARLRPRRRPMERDDGDDHHVGGRPCRSSTVTIGCICRCPPGATADRTSPSRSRITASPANGLRLLNNIHGDRTAFSENWYNRARQWLPMIDHPADKATGELIVTTKADYQVVSNGVHRRAAGSARRTAAHALEAGRADLVVAVLPRRRALHRAPGRRRPRRAAVVLGVSAGRRRGCRRSNATRAGRSNSSRIASARTCTPSSRTSRPPAWAAARSTRATSSTARRA